MSSRPNLRSIRNSEQEEKYANVYQDYRFDLEHKESYQNILTDHLIKIPTNKVSQEQVHEQVQEENQLNFEELSLYNKECKSSNNPNDEFENMLLQSAKVTALTRFGELFINSNTVTIVEFFVKNNKTNKKELCKFVLDIFTTDACYFTKNSAKRFGINYDTNYSNHYVCGLIPYMDLFPTLRYPKESSDIACPMLVVDRLIPGDIDGILSQNFLIKYDGVLSYKKNTLILLDDIVIDVKIEELR